MPVYGYEIDYRDPPASANGSGPPATTPTGSARVAGWLVQAPPSLLDANQLVLQAQQVGAVTALARTGHPTARYTPIWPSFNTTSLVMSWAPGGDSQVIFRAQMSLDYNCGFWDRIAPGL